MEGGRESYYIETEFNDKGTKAAKKAFEELGKAAADASKNIDKCISSNNRAVDELAKKVEALENENKELKESINEEIALRQELNKELTDTKDKLEKLTSSTKNHTSSTDSSRTALKTMREELIRMEQSGQRGSNAYVELSRKAAELADNIGDAQRQIQILSSDEKVFQGLISGMNGVAGAASAVQGAMGLVVGENEDLQRVMLKVQSLMSITVGLQQLEQALNKDSAFRLVIINGLKRQLAAVTTAYNVSLFGSKRAAVASGAAHVGLAGSLKAVGAAIKAIPIIGWVAAIGGAVAAISLFSSKSKEAIEQEKKMEEQTKRINEAYSEYSKEASRNTATLVQKYNDLRRKWAECHTTLQKKQFLVEQKDAMGELGLKVNDVVSAENVFVNNTSRVISALRARSQMTALSSLETKAYEDYYNQVTEAEEQLGSDILHAKQKQGFLGNKGEQADRKAMEIANNQYAERLIDAQNEKNKKLDKVSEERQRIMKKLAGANDLVGDPVTNTKKSSNTSAKDDREERLRKEREYNEKLAKESRESAFRVRQASIDGMKDGFEKEMRQIQLEYDMQVAAIKDREAEMKKAAEAIGKEVTPLQKAQINADLEIALDSKDQKINKLLERLQNEYATVEQTIHNISEKYRVAREAMYTDKSMTTMREGFTNDNVQALNEKEKNELDAYYEEVAQKQEEYQDWVDALVDMSVAALQEKVNEAKIALRSLGEDASATDVAVAKAKVNKAEASLREAQRSSKPENIDGGLKKWKKLHEILKSVNDDFKEIGDSIGGVAGEAIKTASTIATSTLGMVNSIVTVVKMSSQAVNQTSDAASKSMQTLEKASAILAIVSAAMQVFTGIFNAFSGSNMESMQKQQDNLTASNKDLQGSIDRLRNTIDKKSGSDAVAAYEKALELTKQQERNAQLIMQAEAQKWERGSHSLASQLNDDSVFRQYMQSVSAITKKSVTGVSDFLGLSAEDLKKINDSDSELWLNILQAFRSKENDHTGEDIDEMLNDLLDKYSEAYENLTNSLVESLTTISIDTLENDWQNLLTDMSASGKQFSDDFKGYLRDAIANSLIKKEYSQRLEKLTKDFSDQMKDGTLTAQEAAVLQGRYQELYREAMDKIKSAYEAAGLEEGIDQSYTSGGVASMSEDTAEELNGRFAALQIAGQTMAQSLQEMQSLSMISLNHLDEIAKNTRELYSMNERLTEISNKL